MNSRDVLILGGLGAVGLYLYSQQASANINDSLNADGSGSGSSFDFNTLIGSMTDSIKNVMENMVYGTTRGERNNNPGNLRYSVNNPWQGSTGIDSAGFVIFSTPEFGLRAMFIDLASKINRGLNTLNLLIPVYAPPSENNTQAYITSVSGWSGFPPDAILGPGNVPILAQAMIRMENGDMPYNQSQLAWAANAAGLS